jgi:type IV pilus assembly protein PilB
LVSWGKLTSEQLRTVLDSAKDDHRRLGDILLSRKLVSGEDLARAVAEATGFEYVSLSESSVDPTAVSLLGEKVLRKYRALPLRVEGGRLVLATSDPTNVLALDDLKTLAGYPIRPVVAAGLVGEVLPVREIVRTLLSEAEKAVDSVVGLKT